MDKWADELQLLKEDIIQFWNSTNAPANKQSYKSKM